MTGSPDERQERKPKGVAKKVVRALVGVEKHIVGLRPAFFKFFGRLGLWTRRTIKLLIPFAVLLIFTFVPMGIDTNIRYMLGIFLCVALMWAFESLPLPITSLLAPALLVLYGIFPSVDPMGEPLPPPAVQAFAPFADPVVYVILGGLIIAEAFRRNGIDKRLSLYLISKSKGEFKWLLLAIMVGAALLSMWISNTATAALLIPVTIGIAHKVTQEKEEGHRVAVVLLLAVAASTIIGGMATIIGSSPNAVASGFLAKQEGVEWGFANWMIIGVPLSMILLFMSWAILLKFYPVGVDKIDLSWVEEERKDLGPISNDEKKVLIIFGGAVAFWIFGEGVASLLRIPVPYIGGFSAPAVVAALAAVLLFVTRALDWEDAKLIPWGLFLIVGAGLSLGQGMIESGAADWLGDGLISATSFLEVLGDPLYVMMLLLIISFVAVALSNFMNNTATAAVLVPILISMAGPLGIVDIKIVVLPVAFSMVLSFATPVATPSSTLVYGTGMVRKRELAVTGLLISTPAIIITVLFSFLFAHFGLV
jgi:sodium-dependent dicarboxylate transporter 2/3/5